MADHSRRGFDLEKKVLRAAEQDRADVAAARAAFREEQPRLDPRKLKFLDETGAHTKMTRLYARGPRGKRVVDAVPHGHWKIITFVGLLGAGGISAPLVIDGPMNGDLFVAYIKQQVVSTLEPGDIVILDNLSSHKRKEAREAIEAVGCRMIFLPPYSPDLNPIELAFSKLKSLLRAAGKRTVEDLENFLGEALDLFIPEECLNYMRHCGYNATAS